MSSTLSTWSLKQGFARTLPLVIAVSLTCFTAVQAAEKRSTYCMNAGADNNYDCSKSLDITTNQADIDAKLSELNRWLQDEESIANGSKPATTSSTPTDSGLRQKIEFNSQLLADELKQANQLQTQGNHQAAFDQVNNYLVTNPKDPNGWLLYGISLMDQNKLDAAANVFSKLIKLYPNAPEPYNNLAAIYAKKGDNDKAVDTLLQAFNTHPSYAQVQQNLKTVYATLATQAYNRALDLDEGSSAGAPQLAILDQVYQQPVLPEKTTSTAAPTLGTTLSSTITSSVTQDTAQKPAKLVIEERKVSEGTIPVLEEDTPAKPQPIVNVVAKTAATNEEVTEDAGTIKGNAAHEVAAAIDPALQAAETQRQNQQQQTTSPAAQVASQQAANADDLLSETNVQQIHDLISQWAKSWSDQDVDRYISFYTEQYQPDNKVSNKQWRWGRNQRLNKPKYIKVAISDISLAAMPEGRIRTVFLQSYESNTFSDSVYKTLIFVTQNGEWKIAAETSL
ncbi:L,D-transpeptidase Cds6 family protein [Amphritea sp. HPY]|uniref:L,D-transpeptidase Cds6 family protein n=1 Tax=Amphritea sp. HPY TaxID=3421652 RepID=UPI003D7D09A7